MVAQQRCAVAGLIIFVTAPQRSAAPWLLSRVGTHTAEGTKLDKRRRRRAPVQLRRQRERQKKRAGRQRERQKRNGALRLQEGGRKGHLRKRGSSDAQGRRTALRHQDHRSKVFVSRRSEVGPTRSQTAGNPKAPAHRLPSRKFWKEELARRTRSVYCDGVLLGRRFGTVGFEKTTATQEALGRHGSQNFRASVHGARARARASRGP